MLKYNHVEVQSKRNFQVCVSKVLNNNWNLLILYIVRYLQTCIVYSKILLKSDYYYHLLLLSLSSFCVKFYVKHKQKQKLCHQRCVDVYWYFDNSIKWILFILRFVKFPFELQQLLQVFVSHLHRRCRRIFSELLLGLMQLARLIISRKFHGT